MGKKPRIDPSMVNSSLHFNPNSGGFGSSGETVGGPGSGSMSMYSPLGANNAFAGMPMQGGGVAGGGAGGAGGISDPYGNAAMGFLQNTLSGKETPFNDTTKSAMLGKASDMSSAAEAARNSSARDAVAGNGADMSDPSARAGMNESMARRQSDNIGAAQNIDMTANRENFNAKTDAANTLAQFSRADANRRAGYMDDLRNGKYDDNRNGGGDGMTFNPRGYGGLDMKGTNAAVMPQAPAQKPVQGMPVGRVPYKPPSGGQRFIGETAADAAARGQRNQTIRRDMYGR